MPTLLSDPMQGRFKKRATQRSRQQLAFRAHCYEVLEVALLAYFFLNGSLNVPAGIAKTAGLFTTACFWLGTTLVLLRYPMKIRWDLWTCRFAFIFIAFTVVSVLWGTSHATALIYPIITSALTFLYFNYLIEHKTSYDFVRLLLWAAALLLLGSILAALFVPGLGIDSGAADPNNRGAWQGIFGQKNQLGIATALATAISLGQLSKNSTDRALKAFVFIAALICAYGSKSREGQLAIFLQLFALSSLYLLRRIRVASRPPVVFVGVVVSIVTGLLIYLNLDSFLAFLGKSPTASGRTNIWRDSLLLVGRRPLLGYGTYGVWKTPYAWTVVVREGWNVPSSHNNYIEILLYYGVIGLCLFAPLFLAGPIFIYRAMLSRQIANVQAHIYILLALAALSLAAPLIVYYPAIGMITLLYSTATLEQVDRLGMRFG